MSAFSNLVNILIFITSRITLALLTVMMVFITVAVTFRGFGNPILGDVEIVQLGMVILISFGLVYSEKFDAHISIGLIIDRLPEEIQKIADVIGYILTIIVTWLIAWIFLEDALDNMTGVVLRTDLLGVPYYPFKYLIVLGFFLWGLEVVRKLLLTFSNEKL